MLLINSRAFNYRICQDNPPLQYDGEVIEPYEIFLHVPE